jgi:hypothetical protein
LSTEEKGYPVRIKGIAKPRMSKTLLGCRVVQTVFYEELVMTLKKLNKTLHKENGQSILEYFILTTVVVTVVLFFASGDYFRDIKTSCENAFNQAMENMLR